MASKKGIDNPFGKMTDYPKPDSFEFDPTKLSPKEQEQLLRDSVDIDDPFEGKKLTDLDEPEKGMKSKSKAGGKTQGMTKKAAGSGMAKKAAGRGMAVHGRTPYGMSQKQLSALSKADLAAVWRKAYESGKMMLPKSGTTYDARLAQRVTSRLSDAGLARGLGRVAPPIAAGLAAHDIYTGLKDPNFMTGLISLFGGEERAYNAWAAQQEEAGVEMPPYEEWRKYAEEMAQAGELDPDLLEMPDTREVAKRALAPRYEQEMGPEDME